MVANFVNLEIFRRSSPDPILAIYFDFMSFSVQWLTFPILDSLLFSLIIISIIGIRSQNRFCLFPRFSLPNSLLFNRSISFFFYVCLLSRFSYFFLSFNILFQLPARFTFTNSLSDSLLLVIHIIVWEIAFSLPVIRFQIRFCLFLPNSLLFPYSHFNFLLSLFIFRFHIRFC